LRRGFPSKCGLQCQDRQEPAIDHNERNNSNNINNDNRINNYLLSMLFCFESAIPENAVNQMNDALVHEKRNRQRRLRRTHHHRRRILPR
jgi:hypothetical protein